LITEDDLRVGAVSSKLRIGGKTWVNDSVFPIGESEGRKAWLSGVPVIAAAIVVAFGADFESVFDQHACLGDPSCHSRCYRSSSR
jgi:hypothetical protein